MDEWFWTIGLASALRGLHVLGGGPPPASHVGDGPDDVATKVGFRTVGGVRIRCAECGGGSAPECILLTSPWPESMYAFAPIWATLARRFRVVAADLPGFGGSERRDDLLSPRAMGAFLPRLIEAAGLDRPHLVAPDVGTAAALFCAARHPELLSSIVVGGGATAVPVQLEGPLAEWVLEPDPERLRAIDPAAVIAAALGTIAGDGPAPEIRRDYLESYAGDRFAESMRYVRRYPEELPELARLLPEIAVPVLIIAARRDRVVPMVNAEFLHARLPDSRLATVDAGHFAWEDAPGGYASLVSEWVAGFGATPAGRPGHPVTP